ncbi:MAG: DNA-binding response regulator [Candidatus Reconcilbacillus cellulovorans]|uniref:DNA-binding response regulator n=1 Tax=Candidatus Reconcilbacillus cellulovorans TaxID=1906605 RepID=A0A2A6E3Q0_9BACL|nr:MAG: DNA-binding response regulator [Candidatus Reconcilbacillus cellulovorans]
MSRRVLVIEDEPTLSRLLSYNLAQEGYAVEVRDHGGEGLQEALSGSYDLIVLDLMLPGMGGMEVLERLRSEGIRTPVVILTARGAEEEIVQGLRLGADDYVTKPFGVAELLARIAAVLRRASGVEPERAEEQENVVAIGGLRIYPDKYEVTVGGRPIALRPKEFEVLLYLVKRPGVVVTRDDLMNAVWGFDYVGGQRTVDVHVSSLRKKLELDGESVRIEAIRGVGYKLVVRQPGEKAVRN